MANCLSNADYFLPECVKIEKYPDRIVLTNPGTILLGKKQMLRGGKSRPRNKVILNMLNYIGVGERAGSGVPNIYSIWEQEGYVEPTVDELSGREETITTVVTLPLIKRETKDYHQDHHQGGNSGGKNGVDWDERKDNVLRLIMDDPTISTNKISEILNLSRRQVERTLDVLKSSGRIHREGSSRSGRWNVSQ